MNVDFRNAIDFSSKYCRSFINNKQIKLGNYSTSAKDYMRPEVIVMVTVISHLLLVVIVDLGFCKS